MTRSNAREIAMHLIFEMDYHGDLTPEEMIKSVFDKDYYPRLAVESDLYQDKPNEKQMKYIEQCVRISKVSLAVLRLAVFEILYLEDAPTGVVINEAVEIARRYEEEDKVSFINGILGSFARTLQ